VVARVNAWTDRLGVMESGKYRAPTSNATRCLASCARNRLRQRDKSAQ